jgi:hypothetical protein
VNGEGVVKKLWKGTPGGRRIKGRPRLRWMDSVELDMKYTGVKIRRTGTSDRIERAYVVGKAKSKIYRALVLK